MSTSSPATEMPLLFLEPLLTTEPDALVAFHKTRADLGRLMKESIAQMQFIHAGNPGGDLLPGEVPVCMGLEDDDHDFYCGCQTD